MADMEVTKKVYSADEIQVILGIGRSKVYEFLDSVNKKAGTVSGYKNRKNISGA